MSRYTALHESKVLGSDTSVDGSETAQLSRNVPFYCTAIGAAVAPLTTATASTTNMLFDTTS